MNPLPTRKKGMAAVRRVSLFRREIRELVSPAGFDALLRSSSRISEGRPQPGGRYFGSTMITLDLGHAREWVRDACDVATALRLARLMEQDAEVLGRVRSIAIEEACRLARLPMERLEVDIRVRPDGCRVFIDADVEGCTAAGGGALDASSTEGASRAGAPRRVRNRP
jgi:hypothetical protein